MRTDLTPPDLKRDYEAALTEWSQAIRNFGRQHGGSDVVQQKKLMRQVDEAAARAALAKKALARETREKDA